MKTPTILIALFHTVYVVGFMWFGPYLLYNNTRQYTLTLVVWLLLSMAMIGHWYIPCMKRECALSLLEKKVEDPTYVTGSDPYKSHMWYLMHQATGVSVSKLFSFHRVVSKTAFLFAIAIVTLQNRKLKRHVAQGLYVILTALTVQHIY